jgi:hypothetical protein
MKKISVIFYTMLSIISMQYSYASRDLDIVEKPRIKLSEPLCLALEKLRKARIRKIVAYLLHNENSPQDIPAEELEMQQELEREMREFLRIRYDNKDQYLILRNQQ